MLNNILKSVFSIVYYIVLLYLYPFVLLFFNYMWKIDYVFNYNNFFISLISISLISFFVTFKSFGLSLLSGLFYFLVVPSLCVATVADYGNSFLFIIASTIITFFLLLLFSRFNIDITKLYFKKNIRSRFNFLLAFFILFVLMKNINSFNLIALLSDVYSFREDNIQSKMLSYLLFWVQSVFIFWVLIKAFFDNKRVSKVFLFLALILGYLSFMVTGLKTVLFSPFFLVIVFIFIKYSKYNFLGFLFFYIFFLLVAGLFFPNLVVLAVIDRVLFLPGLLNLRYIHFFRDNPLYYFKGSKIEFFFQDMSKYNDIPGHIVDSAYGGGGMNANTGAFGSIFSDLGIVGILVIFPLFICFLDFIIRSISKDVYLNSLLGFYYSFVIVNSPPTDIILTHGFIIHVVILYFRNKNLVIN